MNHRQRREVEKALLKRIQRSKAYILLVMDYNGDVCFSGDAGSLNNKDDFRHTAFRSMFNESRTLAAGINERTLAERKKVEQEQKVTATKEKRSEELKKFADAEPVKVDVKVQDTPAPAAVVEEVDLFARPKFVLTKKAEVCR